MALTIVFMLMFAGALVLRDYKNKYNLLFALMALCMSAAMTTVAIGIYRNGNYHFLPGILNSTIELRIFSTLNRRLPLSLTDLVLLQNIGVALYLAINILFALSFTRCIKKSAAVKKRRGFAVNCLAGLFCVLYFLVYHPGISYRMFLHMHTLPVHAQRGWGNLITALDLAMKSAAVLCLIYPILFLIINYARGRLTFFSGQMASLALTLSALNTAFLHFLVFGFFQNSPESLMQTGFWHGVGIVFVPRYYAGAVPVLSFACLLAVSYLLIHFRTTNLLDGIKEYSISKNLQGLYTNLRDIMHSEKNLMFNIRILAEEALELYGTDEGRDKLSRIREISKDQIDSLANSLNSIKALDVRASSHDLYIAIDRALELCPVPDHIALVKDYHSAAAPCSFDLYHMQQAIVNLLSNAIEGTSGRADPRITISVDSSDYWVYLSLTDNGCGIPRKHITKVFTPYFSTKSKQNNWGVGLSYVFRVVKSHYGYIRVKSRANEYTRIEILLNRERHRMPGKGSDG